MTVSEKELQIDLERDVRKHRVLSGGYATDAHLLRGGKYEVYIFRPNLTNLSVKDFTFTSLQCLIFTYSPYVFPITNNCKHFNRTKIQQNEKHQAKICYENQHMIMVNGNDFLQNLLFINVLIQISLHVIFE